MRTYTAEEIVQIVPKELATLRKEFPGVAWAEKLAPMLDKLCEIAAAAPNHDTARLADLERRVSQLIQSDRKLKGLAPALWMIASLKAVEIKSP